MKIGACIMVHNMEDVISATIISLSSLVDGIYIYDDGCTDRTIEIAKKFSKVPLYVETNNSDSRAFFTGELETRNYILDRSFEVLKSDVMICADADEMFSSSLREIILSKMSGEKYDSICFSIWHLYDKERYFHIWQTKINGVQMIDPHTRVLKKGKKYTQLFEDGSHPIIHPTERTFCIDGPYHFHLKYYKYSPYPNHAFNFLPKWIKENDAVPFLKKLPFKLPLLLTKSIDSVDWLNLSRKETDYYDAYNSNRIILLDPSEALIHPKDK